LWCSWRITRDLPDGRAQVGDRHLKIYEPRDNLGCHRLFDLNVLVLLDRHLPAGFGARGGIRTLDLPITSRSLTLRMDPPRPILTAQERDPFHPDPSCGAWYQRQGCQRGCHRAVRAAAAIGCSQSAHCHHPSVTGRISQPLTVSGAVALSNSYRLNYQSQPGPVLLRKTGRWIVQEVDQVQQRVLQRHQPPVVR
jgi:hypothetical protein